MPYTDSETVLNSILSNGSYSFSNPVFTSLASYSSMALLKMLGMSMYTIVQRFRTRNFSTSEDEIYKKLTSQLTLSNTTTKHKNELVERARNNHMNDLENIIPFVLIGLFYIGTKPRVEHAVWHFRVFFLSRILHTIAYQIPLPQPTRTLSWLLGYLSTISMTIPILQSIRF